MAEIWEKYDSIVSQGTSTKVDSKVPEEKEDQLIFDLNLASLEEDARTYTMVHSARVLPVIKALKNSQAQEQGHNQPCYYCGKPCNRLAGNPGQWPIALCHKNEPGVVKWHHEACVQERLVENQKAPRKKHRV